MTKSYTEIVVIVQGAVHTPYSFKKNYISFSWFSTSNYLRNRIFFVDLQIDEMENEDEKICEPKTFTFAECYGY